MMVSRVVCQLLPLLMFRYGQLTEQGNWLVSLLPLPVLFSSQESEMAIRNVHAPPKTSGWLAE